MTSAYPRYRDSGVEWLGQIPDHWKVVQLLAINDDALSGREDPLRRISHVDIGAVGSSAGITTMQDMVFDDAPSRARRLVQDGDTIVSTVRTYLRAITAVRNPPPEMVVSTGFAVIRPRNLVPMFASWVLTGHGFVEEIVARSNGVAYPAINAAEIGEIPVPVPARQEQQAIAAFLDHETARVDELVAQQKRLLERLAEYRAAVITRTVTRGLPSAPGEEGPVAWKQLKSFCTGDGQYGLNVPARHYEDSGIRLIRTSDVTDEGVVRRDGAVYVPDSAVPSEYELTDGDLLLSRSGTLGRCLRYESSVGMATFAGYLIRFRPSADSDPKYLEYCTHGLFFRQAIEAEAPSSTISNFNATRYASTVLPWWPLEVQRAIGQFLDQETRKVDELVLRAELAVERLAEYRSALIAHAVTGAVDVRGSVAARVTGGADG